MLVCFVLKDVAFSGRREQDRNVVCQNRFTILTSHKGKEGTTKTYALTILADVDSALTSGDID